MDPRLALVSLLLHVSRAAPDPDPDRDPEPEPFADVKVDRYAMPTRCPREVRGDDFVRYHFNGTLRADGTRFDSSHDRGAAVVSQVGSGRLLAGVDRGLQGMCVSERRRIFVPPLFAFGSVGAGGVIPPNATLVYDVLLLDIWSTDDEVQIRTMHRPQKCVRAAAVTDFVRYHYNGTLLTGEAFDSSHWRNAAYEAYLGQGELILGVEEGLLGMCVGEWRVVIVPPFLGYGETGSGSRVPPQATLVYEVRMVDVFNSKDDVTVTVTRVPESCSRRSRAGDFVRYHYNGTFQDGTPFDSSYGRKRTFNTYIGKGHVTRGMDQALKGVCVGEKRRVVIPPHLAYGESGVENLIPSWTVLVFDIHVIDFHNPKDPVEIRTLLKPPDCKVTSEAKDWIQYRYNCSLLDGTLLYSSEHYDSPSVATLGVNAVIAGLETGLAGMCVGERREVVVPPHWAHGEDGAAGVPASAVLLFELELVDLQKGVPDGFMFVWVDDGPEPLFPAMDLDGDGQVPLEEFSEFIKLQVREGKGRLRPGVDQENIIKDMFYNQDSNRDGKIMEDEVQLKDDTVPQRDEF